MSEEERRRIDQQMLEQLVAQQEELQFHFTWGS